MGGRKPKSPKIVLGQPPKGVGGQVGLGLGLGIIGRPPLGGGGRAPRTPGYGGRIDNPRGIFTADFRDRDRDGIDDRKQRGPGQPDFRGRGRVRGRKPSRKLTNEEKMRIKTKYDERRKRRKEKGFADRGTIKKGSGRRKFNSCPDPSMLILMSDDTKKKAGELVVGDLVKTCHEKTFELGNYEVEFVDIIKDVEKIKLTFDESTIICSLSHKFYVNDSWKEANDMVIGDVVSDKKLTAIERVEDGDVIHITVKDAHTYICEGLLSHNKRRISPELRDRLNQEGLREPRGGRGGRRGRRRRFPRPSPRPQENKPTAVMETTRVPVNDPTLGGPPEREVPIPKERLPKITRESDPSGPAPFAPDERAMAKDRFFERMFEKADERKQQKSMMREVRGRTKQSMRDESRMRMNEPGEINVGGEININAERRPRRRRRMRRMRRMRR